MLGIEWLIKYLNDNKTGIWKLDCTNREYRITSEMFGTYELIYNLYKHEVIVCNIAYPLIAVSLTTEKLTALADDIYEINDIFNMKILDLHNALKGLEAIVIAYQKMMEESK